MVVMEFYITMPFDNKSDIHYFEKFQNACEFVLSEMKKKTNIKDNRITDYKILKVDEAHWIGTFIMENPIIIQSDLNYNSLELGYYPILKKVTED